MIKKTVIALVGAVFVLAACNSLPLTPVVITATPDPRILSITITNTPAPSTPTLPPTLDARAAAFATLTAYPTLAVVPSTLPVTAYQGTPGAIPSQPTTSAAGTTVSTLAPTKVPPTAAPSGPTATPNLFPPDVRQQIFIAQEDFQGGFMFWIQSTGDIWVLLPATLPKKGDPLVLPTSGQWRIYKDTYQDTEPDVDPTFVPPSSDRFQPRRGFGKLWRSTSELRDALGWATTPEFGLNTSYVYQPGGYVNDKNQYVPGPGTHFLISLNRTTFELKEPEPGQSFGTWKKVG